MIIVQVEKELISLFEVCLLNRLYFRIDALHTSYNSFQFGASFASVPEEFLIHNDDNLNDAETIYIQETGFNLWLGVISIHFGWRGKELEEEIV